jgi:hypothetical protein
MIVKSEYRFSLSTFSDEVTLKNKYVYAKLVSDTLQQLKSDQSGHLEIKLTGLYASIPTALSYELTNILSYLAGDC